MCVLVKPIWLQYECSHFARRDDLPWWIDPCTSRYCVESPMHEDPCENCAETCKQEMDLSPNTIMSGGVNFCGECERGTNRRSGGR